MRKKVFLEVKDTSMVCRESFNKNSIFNIFNKNEINKNVTSIEDIKVELKNRNLIILVHGKEIYVVYMELPRMNRKSLYRAIKEELKNKFKEMDNIMFSYEIIRYNKHSVEAAVFCMKWHNMKLLEKCNGLGARVKGIVPIQFYMWYCCRTKIKSENHMFILVEDDNFYFIAGHKDKIVFNNVFKNMKKQDFLDMFEQFRVKLSILIPNFKFAHIYFLDFPYKDIIEKLAETYVCKELKGFSMKS